MGRAADLQFTGKTSSDGGIVGPPGCCSLQEDGDPYGPIWPAVIEEVRRMVRGMLSIVGVYGAMLRMLV